MERYKFIEGITSDVMFEAYGRTLNDVFANAAEALFSVMCKLDAIQPKEEKKIEVEADSVDDLMVNWLQSLIASVDIECMFFSRFRITEIDDTHLVAFVSGEPVSREKGSTVVKAVTYHQYEFRKTADGYMCRVSLDI
ncbi:archease [Candidatus Woesearchaeota archaeon]|nr:archease [Candidatus Woesearchaeota archaeon]